MSEPTLTTPGPNANALMGLQCPDCGDHDVFEIVVTARAIVFDSGVDSYSEAEWDGASPIRCIADDCGRAGLVSEFTIAPLDEFNQALNQLEESLNTAGASTIEIDTDLAATLLRLARESKTLR